MKRQGGHSKFIRILHTPSTNFVPIHQVDVLIFHCTSKKSDLLPKSQRIAKVSGINSVRTINVSSKFHGNQFYLDQSGRLWLTSYIWIDAIILMLSVMPLWDLDFVTSHMAVSVKSVKIKRFWLIWWHSWHSKHQQSIYCEISQLVISFQFYLVACGNNKMNL